MTFKSKQIAVVGGTSGIGASVLELIGDSATVYNISRGEAAGSTNIQLDVTSNFEKIEGLPDELHGLVYCPGSINLRPFQSLKPEDYQKDFEINVLGAVKVIKASLKSLKKSKNASIVLFSTVAVSQGMSFHASVAASKGAVEGLVRSLAAEFAKSGIRVNAIAPSLTDTPMAEALLSSDEKRKASDDRHPLGRIGKPEDLAYAVRYLLYDQSSWMTGQVIHLDGGMSAIRPF